jgi:hypothetical protein
MNHATCHKRTGKHLFAVMVLMFAWALPALAQDIAGEWEMVMDFNGRQSFATLTISKNPDGTLGGKWGSSELSNVKFEGDKLTFTRTMRFGDNEFTMTYAGILKDGKITGTMSSDRGEFPVNGTRIKPKSPAVGVWDLKYTVGDRDVTAKMTVSQKPDGALDVKYTSELGDSVVSNAKFQDGKLTFDRTAKFNDQEFKMTFAGTIQGDKLTGTFKTDMGEVTVAGTRFGSALIGKWTLTSVSERGTRNLTMVVYPDLTGRYESFGGEIPMKDLKLEGNQVTFAIEMGFGDQTFKSNFKGTLQDGTIKGQMTSERGTSEITGKKLAPAAAAASSIVGTWEFVREGQDGTRRTSTLKIKPDMTGTYTMRDNEVPVTDLKVSGDEVTFKVTMNFGGNDVPMEFKGKLEGKALKGQFISERGPREAVGKKID